MKGSERDDTPVLITEAAPSYDEQHNARRKKYALIMSLRIPCLIAAGLSFHLPWLALAFVILSVPLPWIAVLIANDRPPKKAEKANRYRSESAVKALETKEHPVING